MNKIQKMNALKYVDLCLFLKLIYRNWYSNYTIFFWLGPLPGMGKQ